MNKILVFSAVLLVVWVVLRVALAITSMFLHLLWIIAVILFVMWLIGKFKRPG
jgi:hypothetical protein